MLGSSSGQIGLPVASKPQRGLCPLQHPYINLVIVTDSPLSLPLKAANRAGHTFGTKLAELKT